jgi:hypothetical protein
MNKLILETRLAFQKLTRSYLERKIKAQLNDNIDLEHSIAILQSQLNKGTERLDRLEEVNSKLYDRIQNTLYKIEDIEEIENDALEEYDMDSSKMAIF